VKTNERGFKVYGEVSDSRGCIVRIQESSAMGPPHAWIFVDDPDGIYKDGKPAPHLTRVQAIRVVTALHLFH
jgi:hypothetical protein